MGVNLKNYSLKLCISFCVPRLVLQLLLLEHTPYPPTASPRVGEGNVEPGGECAAHLQYFCAGPGTQLVGDACIPCKGSVCHAFEGIESCPAACWPLSSFLAVLMERTREESSLACPGRSCSQ